MRLLPTAALVLASLFFTIGGVAIVGRADSSADKSPMTKAPAAVTNAAAKPAQLQCETPKPIRPEPIRVGRLGQSDTITLNTRGYNYADPGMIQMDPTGRTKPGQLPDSAVPASPAKP